MRHPYSIRIIVVFLAAIAVECNKDPVSPLTTSLFPYGRFQGTWRAIDSSQSSLVRLSFDSSTRRFVDEWEYDFGFKREFTGSFQLSATTIELDYDYGNNRTLWYRLQNDSLSLQSDSGSTVVPTHLHTGETPQPAGWSTKVSPLSRRPLTSIAHVWSFALSDSGPIALIGPPLEQPQLVGVDSVPRMSSLPSAEAIRAMDAQGPYLWVATDSSVQKRTLNDTTVILSFPLRPPFWTPGTYVTGMAISNDRCVIMSVAAYPKSWLLFYDLAGNFVDSVSTSRVVKDLCLFNNRLFCSVGDETFYEVNMASGKAQQYFNLQGYAFGDDVAGIAFKDGSLQLLEQSAGVWRISSIAVP